MRERRWLSGGWWWWCAAALGCHSFSHPSACWETPQPTVMFYRINMQRVDAKEDFIAHVCSLDVDYRIFPLICYWLNMDTFAVHILQSPWHPNPMLSMEWKSGGEGISIDHQSVPEVAKILHIQYNFSLTNSVIKATSIKKKRALKEAAPSLNTACYPVAGSDVKCQLTHKYQPLQPTG